MLHQVAYFQVALALCMSQCHIQIIAHMCPYVGMPTNIMAVHLLHKNC